MEFEIIHKFIREIQQLIMDREAGLETRDQILETLDELLDVAQGTIRKLRLSRCPRCMHEIVNRSCACAGHGGG